MVMMTMMIIMFVIHWLRLGSNQEKAADRPETQLASKSSMSDRDCDDDDDEDGDGYGNDDDGDDGGEGNDDTDRPET